jgi:hypothetical protein
VREAAYFFSKEAEVILAPFVQLLVGAESPPTISSPLLAATWDYSFNNDLLVGSCQDVCVSVCVRGAYRS